jgi:hypothetical protein
VDLGNVRRLDGGPDTRLFHEHRNIRRLRCEILVHLFDGHVADKPPITAHATAPYICHATSAGNFYELVSPSDD